MTVQTKAESTAGTKRQKGQERSDKRERITGEAIEMLENGVDELLSGADFKQYLDLMSKVHDYSWGNTLLIMRQIPSPTLVMPYGDKKKTYGWKSVGRYVKAGEKGAVILRPDKRWIEDEDNPGTKKQIVVGFRPAYVYDVAQTDGDPLPNPPTAKELTGESTEARGLIELLWKFVDTIGWRCFDDASQQLEMHGHPDANGMASYRDKQIFIAGGLSEHQYAKTLLHECIHAKMHFDDRTHLTRSTVEMEAEGAAYVVCSHFGVDTSEYSFGYVAGWSRGKESFKAALKQISNISGFMIEALNNIGKEQFSGTYDPDN